MDRIFIVSADLSQEEAIMRIIEAAKQFIKVSNDVFTRVERRADGFEQRYERTRERAELVRQKVERIRELNKSVRMIAPSRFPPNDCQMRECLFESTGTIFRVGMGYRDQEPFTPLSPKREIDIRRMLEENKLFFCVSQLMKKEKRIYNENCLPPDLSSVADLYFYNTNRLAYEGVARLNKKNKKRNSTGTAEAKSSVKSMERTAMSTRRMDKDPLAYEPDVQPLEDFDLPSILPDLPGIAEDVSYNDGCLTSPMFDLPMFSDLITIPCSKEDAEIGNLSKEKIKVVNNSPPSVQPLPPVILVKEENFSSRHSFEPPLPLVSELVTISVPPPPPPPPLPPTSITAMFSSSTVPPSSSMVDSPTPAIRDGGRASLMESIRAAGGAGKARLKKIDDTQRKKQKTKKEIVSTSDDSSALSKSGSGDLMSALAKALDARRKYISGKQTSSYETSKISGALGRKNESISLPPEGLNEQGDESVDEEWK